ncbi:MAG TPA: BrnT family toxin [Terriglobia bacterium]|nr:BrnT family toxin [Terriglobia bacterium]
MKEWAECVGFDWDDGNINKNWEKHGVTDSECEEVFFNRPFAVRQDPVHSSDEERRWRAFGQTDRGRYLLVAFTVRRYLIRIVSARLMTRRERRFYASYEKSESQEA